MVALAGALLACSGPDQDTVDLTAITSNQSGQFVEVDVWAREVGDVLAWDADLPAGTADTLPLGPTPTPFPVEVDVLYGDTFPRSARRSRTREAVVGRENGDHFHVTVNPDTILVDQDDQTGTR